MSTESANPTSNMSDSVSSASDSGHEMTNETEEYPDDVSEVYSSEIFETVKKALRADRRVAQYAVETRQCLQAILTFVEAERLAPEEIRNSREFLSQVFPHLWKRVLREPACEDLIIDFEAWGRFLAKITLTLLEKLTEMDYKLYQELTLRGFNCLGLFFDADTLIYRNQNFQEIQSALYQREGFPSSSNDSEDVWPKNIATEIVDSSIELVCKMVEHFFSQQIYEEYTDPYNDCLLVTILELYSQMVTVLTDKEVLIPLCNVIKSSISDVRKSPVENFSFTFQSSTNFLEYLYRIVYFAENVESAEQTAGEFRRHILKEELKQGNFKSQLTAVRSLTSYLDYVVHYEDSIPRQRLQTWLNEEDIVGMMLGSHVEKMHYAEHVLNVLERLVKVDILETEHIDALWSLVEPDGVFEGLRDNVVNITGVLAKQLKTDHVKFIIERIGKGIGSAGYAKNFMILGAILQREDPSVDYVEPLLKLFWDVLLEMAKLDDTGKTFNFKQCIQNYFERGCRDLPEKYLNQSIDILQNGQISMTMVQVFSDMYLLAHECYPHNPPEVDPLELLISTLERYHSLVLKETAPSSSHSFYFCRFSRLILHICHSFNRPMTLDLVKRFWNVCVLHPLNEMTRQDALLWLHERLECQPQFLTIPVLSDFLHESMCRLDVSQMDPQAFACFRGCFFKVMQYFEACVDDHPATDTLWKIFLNTQIAQVVKESKCMIIQLYFHFNRLNKFMQRLSLSLTESLRHLAGLPNSTGCGEIIEKLYEENIQIEGIHGMYIARCIDALDFSLSPTETDKQLVLTSALKTMLSQSESMNQILVFLADSRCSPTLRASVCVVLDSLHVYQPLMMSLNEILKTMAMDTLVPSLDVRLFPSSMTKRTVEQTRYALRALVTSLRCVLTTKDDFAEIACICLGYILDTISRVNLSHILPSWNAVLTRLHWIGVDIVGQLIWQLRVKANTSSAHSSPQMELPRPSPSDQIVRTESMEFHSAMEYEAANVSETSPNFESDPMDISMKSSDVRRMEHEAMEDTAGHSSKEGMDDPNEPKRRFDNVTEIVYDSSSARSPEMVDADRCMSVDSVSGAVQATSIEETEMEPLSNIMERVIEYLVKVLNEASRGWMPRADPDIMDVSLVEQAVDQLIKLIDPSTRAFDLLLAFPGIIEILMRNILNPMAKIRYAIWRLATAISRKNESAAESLYKWAISNRLQADQVSVHCSEYYQLIEQYIRTNLVHPNREQIEDMKRLLHVLMDGIRESPYESESEGMKLCNQLKLCITLLNILESESTAGLAEGELSSFLIHRVLFSEAVLLKTVQDTGELLETDCILEIMETKSNPDCARQAAFQLLLKLFRSSQLNQKLILESLNELHFGHHAAVREVAGSNAVRAHQGYVGLQNGGATCYINSVIQQLFMQPAVRDTILAATTDREDEDQSHTAFGALQKVFGYLQASNRRCYYPREFLENFTHSDGTRIDVRQHHDALEFFQRTQELVDEYLVRHGMKPIIKNVVGTTHVQQIICKDNGETYISALEETYTSCSLDIVGKANLHESLEAYVQGELLEGSDAYHCEPIGKKVPALKRLCLKSPPMNLILQLKRFEMDYQLMETYKINDRFEFPLELNIYAYTASGLMQNEGITKHNGGDDGPKLFPAQCYYHLKGIVVHTGEIDGGHYYSFIKEKPNGGYRNPKDCTWWRFDDSFVEVWDINRLDEDCFGGTTELEMHDAQRMTKMNNAYILIYEHVPLPQDDDPNMANTSRYEDLRPVESKTFVPHYIEREVLNDNLVLLAACRLAEKNYMHFILQLLNSLPNKDSINRRKMRRVTPESGHGESNTASSSGSVSPEKSLDDGAARGENMDETAFMVKSIATIVCEYIFKVILTPYVFLHADGIKWVDAISIIVENNISRDIALHKLVDHAERCFRCLVLQGNEAAKDFLSQFLTKLIQSLVDDDQGSPETLDLRIMKFLFVVLEYLEHRWNLNYDVSRVLDIACLIVEVLYRHGNRSHWLTLFESLLNKSSRFSRIVYINGRGQYMRSLDITNRCVVRLVRSCLQRPDLDEDNPYRNPSVGLDPNAILIIEKFAPQRQLIKSLLRPYLITDPGTILLLKLMSYDNEHGSLTLLDSMQDYLPELEHVNGEVFVRIVDAFLDLAAVHDRYDSAKLSYLVNKGNPSGTPWQYIIIKIQPLLRWRLLYFLMKAQERDERIKEDTPPPREWDRVLDWMNRDKANAPTMPGEAWLDKEEIYEWASHVESM